MTVGRLDAYAVNKSGRERAGGVIMEDLFFYIVGSLPIEEISVWIGEVIAPYKSANAQKNIGCITFFGLAALFGAFICAWSS